MRSLYTEQFGELKKKCSKNSLDEVLGPLLTYLEKDGHGSDYSVFRNGSLKAVKVVWIVKEKLHLKKNNWKWISNISMPIPK